jgi:hypothetical protein
MKKLFFSLLAVLIYATGFSQAFTTTALYQKSEVPALQIEIPYPSKTVDKAIDDMMSKMGYNGKGDRDYTVYKDVKAGQISSTDAYDLYFETDRKSRGEKNITTVTFLISPAYGKFVSDSTNPTVVENGKQFLNNLVAIVTAYDLEQQISDQQDIVKKADKKLNNLVDDGNDLAKKEKKIEDDIQQNSKDQADQKAELLRQKQILATLMSQRR